MAEAGQVPADTTERQVPTATTTDNDQPQQDQGTQDAPKTYDEAYVKQLRAEAAANRSKLRAYEQAEETRKQAEMSELERIQQRAQAAEVRIQEMEKRAARSAAIHALEKANVIDADLAYSAIADRIEIKDGEAANVGDLVAEFIKAKPHMLKAAAPAAPTLPETKPTNPPAKPVIQSSRPVGRL